MTTVKIYVGCIDGVNKVGPVLCGDIRLADDSDYIANGFVVTSILDRSTA